MRPVTERNEVLEQAAKFRSLRKSARAALRTRSMTLQELFDQASSDPLLGSSKVASLMWVIPGVGKVRTLQRLEELGVAETVTIGDLTAAHRASLIELARGRLLVVSGPSGVGKGTVIRALAEETSFHLSVSATTRNMRPGEVDGENYFFLTEPEFRKWVAADRMLEWAEYAGNLYGTPRAPVEAHLEAGRDVVLEIEVQGARQVKMAMPESILVFILPPSIEELEKRLEGRGDTANVAERLETAKRELEEVPFFDFTVVNDDVERAAGELRSILRILPKFRM